MYGAPLPLDDHAYRACGSALRVQARLSELRDHWRGRGEKWPPMVSRMRTRIGLNTGKCMIGNMGSRSRFSYTMMGDDVNLAARMESGAKSWGVYDMVTGATRVACESHAERAMVFRSLDRIRVKGRQQAVDIHELAGFRDELTDAEQAGLAEFERGLAHYHAREWEAASAVFTRSAPLERMQPNDSLGITSNPSLVYARLTKDLAQRDLPDDWDGTYTMTTK